MNATIVKMSQGLEIKITTYDIINAHTDATSLCFSGAKLLIRCIRHTWDSQPLKYYIVQKKQNVINVGQD